MYNNIFLQPSKHLIKSVLAVERGPYMPNTAFKEIDAQTKSTSVFTCSAFPMLPVKKSKKRTICDQSTSISKLPVNYFNEFFLTYVNVARQHTAVHLIDHALYLFFYKKTLQKVVLL
jgi:hypothetical protein